MRIRLPWQLEYICRLGKHLSSGPRRKDIQERVVGWTMAVLVRIGNHGTGDGGEDVGARIRVTETRLAGFIIVRNRPGSSLMVHRDGDQVRTVTGGGHRSLVTPRRDLAELQNPALPVRTDYLGLHVREIDRASVFAGDIDRDVHLARIDVGPDRQVVPALTPCRPTDGVAQTAAREIPTRSIAHPSAA